VHILYCDACVTARGASAEDNSNQKKRMFNLPFARCLLGPRHGTGGCVLRCMSQAARPAKLSFLPCLARAVWMPPCIAQTKNQAFVWTPCLPYGIGVFLARSRPSALFFAIPCAGSYCRHENEVFCCTVVWPMFWPGIYIAQGLLGYRETTTNTRAGHNQSIETAEWQTWPTMTTRVWTNTSALQSSNTAK
jgi:hypothetical protein